MDLKAYAKINLCLAVTGRRADGYHLLDTWMQRISLADNLRLSPADDIQLVTDRFPGPKNLAYRAAALLREASGTDKGVRIELEKRIPAGAGLGGGSADAAAVLSGLNELWGLSWPREKLLPLAAKLGADVPFCLLGGLARCRGVGEEMERLPMLPKRPLLVLFPGEGVSTPACFAAWDEDGVGREGPEPPRADEDERSVYARLFNDLEAPALRLMPELASIRPALEKTKPLYCGMSGSGAAYFALYEDESARAQALTALAPHGWELYAAEIVE